MNKPAVPDQGNYRDSAMMELTQLRHFLAAVRHGNLVKAAEEQNITQSGLSRSIINLERRLNMPLLERGARGITPTAFGLSLIPHANLILNQAARAARELQSIKSMHVGTVSIGVTLNYSQYFIPRVLDHIFAKFPGIQIEIEAAEYAKLLRRIKNARIDFFFGLIGVDESLSSLSVEELFSTRSLIVCRPQHPLVGEVAKGSVDLSSGRWAMLNGSHFQQSFLSYFAAHRLATPHQVLRTNSLDILRHAIMANDFLSILPRELVADDLDSGKLAVITVPMPMASTPAGLIYKSEAIFTPVIQFVMDNIRAYARTLHEGDTECDARRALRRAAKDGPGPRALELVTPKAS